VEFGGELVGLKVLLWVLLSSLTAIYTQIKLINFEINEARI